MKKSAVLLILALCTFAGILYFMLRTKSPEANLLLVNGNIYTLDAAGTVADGVAIAGNSIIEVGRSADLRSKYPKAEVIDLNGRTVVPGLVDGHGHVLGEGTRVKTLDLVGTESAEQIASLVTERAASARAGEWIIGRGWDQNDWKVQKFPSRELLDKAAPHNPVVLRRVDGHAMWVNNAALEVAHVGKETQDIDGGKIYREPDGSPTGVLVDNAMEVIERVMPELSKAEIAERLKAAMQECASLGITEVHDMGVDLETIETYKELIDSNEAPIRIYAAIGDALPSDEQHHDKNAWRYIMANGPILDYGRGLLNVRAVKLYMDGALGSRGAALMDEYSDDPGNRGLTVLSETRIDSICRQSLEKGIQVCIHAIGDRGNHIVLNEYERALKEHPEKKDVRWRIEHAQVLALTDIPRFAQLGVIPAMQPTHATSDMYWAQERLGPERIKGAYAWKSLINAGSVIVGGSDFPVEGVNPLWGIYAAVTRQDQKGFPEGGWRPEECMTRLEAVKAFTQWPAYGSFQEKQKGSIEPGKWADFTVLSRDIMKIPAPEILATVTEMTIVNGKVVYDRRVKE